jgi:hypothetical protein
MQNQGARNLLTLSHQDGGKTLYHHPTSMSIIAFVKESEVAKVEVPGRAQIRNDAPPA